MAARRLLQRMDDGLGRGDRSGGQQRLQLRPLLGEVAGVGGRPCAPADADRVDVVEQQPVDLDGRDLAAGEADHQQPPAGGQRPQRIGEPVAADRVDDDVHAAAVGQLLDGVLEPVGQHDVGGARRPRDVGLVLGADDRDGARRAPGRRQPQRRGADAARRAVHQHRLAWHAACRGCAARSAWSGR